MQTRNVFLVVLFVNLFWLIKVFEGNYFTNNMNLSIKIFLFWKITYDYITSWIKFWTNYDFLWTFKVYFNLHTFLIKKGGWFFLIFWTREIEDTIELISSYETVNCKQGFIVLHSICSVWYSVWSNIIHVLVQ